MNIATNGERLSP